jgi:hypothetical protein
MKKDDPEEKSLSLCEAQILISNITVNLRLKRARFLVDRNDEYSSWTEQYFSTQPNHLAKLRGNGDSNYIDLRAYTWEYLLHKRN